MHIWMARLSARLPSRHPSTIFSPVDRWASPPSGSRPCVECKSWSPSSIDRVLATPMMHQEAICAHIARIRFAATLRRRSLRSRSARRGKKRETERAINRLREKEKDRDTKREKDRDIERQREREE